MLQHCGDCLSQPVTLPSRTALTGPPPLTAGSVQADAERLEQHQALGHWVRTATSATQQPFVAAEGNQGVSLCACRVLPSPGTVVLSVASVTLEPCNVAVAAQLLALGLGVLRV